MGTARGPYVLDILRRAANHAGQLREDRGTVTVIKWLEDIVNVRRLLYELAAKEAETHDETIVVVNQRLIDLRLAQIDLAREKEKHHA